MTDHHSLSPLQLVFKMLDAQGNIKVLSRRKALLETYVFHSKTAFAVHSPSHSLFL